MAKTDYEMIEKSLYSGKISKLYNRLAWVYDFFTYYELPHHKKAVHMANIRKEDSVLEVACGTGRAAVEIAQHIGGKGKFHAIDITEGMLKKAEKKLKKLNLLDRVDLKLGNAKNLSFPDNTFDIVYNGYMFDLIDASEIPKIVSEFKRVLKPGGKLVLVNMSKNKKGKILYETLYEKGLLGFVSGSCRPVILKPFLEDAGFEKIERTYGSNFSMFPLSFLTGTEIVIGSKPH